MKAGGSRFGGKYALGWFSAIANLDKAYMLWLTHKSAAWCPAGQRQFLEVGALLQKADTPMHAYYVQASRPLNLFEVSFVAAARSSCPFILRAQRPAPSYTRTRTRTSAAIYPTMITYIPRQTCTRCPMDGRTHPYVSQRWTGFSSLYGKKERTQPRVSCAL